MNSLKLIALFLLCVVSLCAVGEHPNKAADFSQSSKYGRNMYSTLNDSGCTTEIETSVDSLRVSITYGEKCEIDRSQLEPVDSIAKSIKKIIRHFDIENVIRSKRRLSINVIWKISHWPMIKSVNENRNWEVNVVQQLTRLFPDENVQYGAYKMMLRQIVVDSEVYLSIMKEVESLSCIVSLADDFADPIYKISDRNILAKDLIEWGVFSPDEVQKDVYPLIKGPILFDIKCD